MDATRRRWRRAAALAAVVSLAGAAQASAAITVTTTADSVGDADAGACLTGGACTLRQALFAARAGEAITLPAGRYELTEGELAIEEGDRPAVVTVNGAGAASTTIAQQSGNTRVLRVLPSGSAVISGVTITGGNLQGGTGPLGGNPGRSALGGGISNDGTLTLSEVVVTDNEAIGGDGGVGSAIPGPTAVGGPGGTGLGGGLFNEGRLLLRRATVSGNRAKGGEGGNAGLPAADAGAGGIGWGAGIANTGTLTVEDSTVSHNVAQAGPGGSGTEEDGVGGEAGGGGVGHEGEALSISGSTFFDNEAEGGQGGTGGNAWGGGVAAGGPFAISRSTLDGNHVATGDTVAAPLSAAVGGGLYVYAEGTVDATTFVDNRTRISTPEPSEGSGGSISTLRSDGAVTVRSSLLAFGGGAAGARNCSGTVTSGGGNVATTDASECGFGAGDTAGADLDGLPGLANNGGPTETIALRPGSPALGAGLCAAAATDQRGMAREGSCDAGAFERTVPQIELQAPLDMLTNAATLKALLRDTSGATYQFSYGLADAGEHPQGSRTPAVTGTTPVAVEQQLSGLAEGQTYKYRLVVRGADGDASAEGAFRTAIKGPPPPVPGPDPGPGRQLPPTPKPPLLSKLSAAPRAFQVRKARRHGRKRRVSGGTTVRFTLETAATVKARVERLPARRGGKPSLVGTLSLGSLKAGANKVTVTGKVGRRTLAPGRYRFTLTAQNGALTSRAVTLVLVVRRG